MIFVWWGSEWGKWARVKATKNLTIDFFFFLLFFSSLVGWAVTFDACSNVFGKDRDTFRWGGYGEEETCPALPHSDATLGDTVGITSIRLFYLQHCLQSSKFL